MADRTHPPCSVDGCTTQARSPKAKYCEKHYMRWYRHGDPTAGPQVSGFTVSKGRRYKAMVVKPDHPLYVKGGRQWVHRMVLFDVIGFGPHACHWCATPVTWGDNLHVDHLDDIGDNNDPANLVPSCPPCNTNRAVAAKVKASRVAGYWSGLDAHRPKRSAA